MKRVVVLGGAAIDWVAHVEELPPRDGFVVATRFERYPGGSSANVAVGIAKQGYPVGFVGKLGNDADGRKLLGAFELSGVDTSRVIVEADASTAKCFVAVDHSGDRILISLPGTTLISDSLELDPPYLRSCDLLYIGANKIPVAESAMDCVEGKEAPIIFAPGGGWGKDGMKLLANLIARTDILLLSRPEALQLAGTSDIPTALKRLKAQCSGSVVITLGSDGAIANSDGQVLTAAAFPSQIIRDTTGAGDAFAAGLATALLDGGDLGSAMTRGCATATLKIQISGARGGMPDKETVDNLLESKKA